MERTKEQMNERPAYKTVLQRARKAVEAEAKCPHGWSYNRQAVEHEILNSFAGLTNSDADYEFIVDAIREAEQEYNERHDCEL